MSLVYITHHNENIRDIEMQRKVEKHYKFPIHVSMYRKKKAPLNQIEKHGKKVMYASYRYSHKTMGYAETPLVNPSQFLKKNGGVKWRRFNDHVCPPPRGMPPVPKRSEIPKKAEPKKENFIKKNVKRIKTTVPFNLPNKYVDTAAGERHNLDGAGLCPKYVLSKKFGKTPAYLKAIKRIIEKCTSFKPDRKVAYDGMTVLSDTERNTILKGLKANHVELMKIYQAQPLFVDTVAKRVRKAKIDAELKKLEQDILLIESNPVILICGD